MITTIENPLTRLSSRLSKSFVGQAFRKETGDGGLVLSKNGSFYKLVGVIGVGGLSVVYKAVRFADSKEVALKVASESGGEQARELLKREARILARLDHPNIVKVLEFGEAKDGEHFLAMEFIAGQPLDQLLISQGGSIPMERAARIVLQAAEALEHAHSRNICHRDVKPANVLVSSSQGLDSVSLFDFGIAVDFEREKDLLTGQDSPGSPLYVTPEQLANKPCNHKSDLYQLALVLFEALTGRLPFAISVSAALAYRREEGPLLPADDELADRVLPASIRAILESALARDPRERPSSIGLFAHALRQTLRKTRIVALRPETQKETIPA